MLFVIYEHDVLFTLSSVHDSAEPRRDHAYGRPGADVFAHVYSSARDVPWLLDG